MTQVAAVIAEFDPFHNGHKYLIDRVRESLNASYVIAIMSGDYTQRGVPAITTREIRTRMALENGIDLVLSYPVRYCTSSAESFAEHAVRILDRLGVVTHLAFGSECGDIAPLTETAKELANESSNYKEALKDGLRRGLSFPEARAAALPSYARLLDGSNNVLALEYIKSLIRLDSTIEPVTIRRKGAAHLDDQSLQDFPSGAAIRRALSASLDDPLLRGALPESSLTLLNKDLIIFGITSENDLSLLLADRIWHSDDPRDLSRFADVTDDLANSIINKRTSFRTFSDFAERLKTRNLTRTHINRALLHIALDIKKEPAGMPDNLYAQVLGFRKDKEELLGLIKENASLPLVTRASKAGGTLSGKALELFEEENRVSNLYETVRAQKSGEAFRHVLTKPIVIV